MNLCNLIGKHITIVVVSRHTESSIGPTDQLHRGSIRDKMLQISSRPIKQTLLQEFILVTFIKDLLHCSPKSFLPLEYSLLGDNVWRNLVLQAPFEEQMCQISNIIIWVVIHDAYVVIISQISLVHDKWSTTILGDVGGKQCSSSNLIPSSTILSSHCMTLKEHLILVS